MNDSNKNTPIENDDTEEIDCSWLNDVDYENFEFAHAYLEYSQWRIKQVFLDYYGCELRPYFNWYKAMRYQPCQRYVITSIADNTIFGSEYGYTFEDLRYFLAKNNFPLHEETDIVKQRKKAEAKYKRISKRNQNAKIFLQIVENIGSDDIGDGRN